MLIHLFYLAYAYMQSTHRIVSRRKWSCELLLMAVNQDGSRLSQAKRWT